MSFTSGQVLTAAQLNDLDIDSLTLTDATPVLTLKDTNSTGTSNFAIKFTDSADTDLARIYGGGGNDLRFEVAGNDVLFVSDSERVGINTPSGPTAELEVRGASDPEIRIIASDGSDPALYFGDSTDAVRGGLVFDTSENDLQFRGYNNSTVMTIESDGQVGIGTTSPEALLHVNAGTVNLGLLVESTDTGAIIGLKDPGTSGSAYVGIRAEGNDLNLRAGNSNHVTVLSGGNVGVGTTSPVDRLSVGDSSTAGSFRVHASGGGESFRVTGTIVRSTNIRDLTTGSAANVYVATSNGSIYRSTSSLKYKTNVETMEDSYADAILGLRPVWYRSLCPDDPESYGYWGFIAEEVAEVDPRLVSFGVPDDYEQQFDEDGEPIDPAVADLTEPEGVQYDRLVPHLVNLLKRQEARIAALEAA